MRYADKRLNIAGDKILYKHFHCYHMVVRIINGYQSICRVKSMCVWKNNFPAFPRLL